MSYESVPGLDIALDAGVLRLTLDRPEKRNAIDDTMMTGLIGAVQDAGEDEQVRAIVLSGRGDDFCAGFDIIGRNTPGRPTPRTGSIQRRLPSHAHRLIPMVLEVQTPVVCAVRGWAAGIGLNLAIAADFTVAAVDARFWAPFVARGFTADSGSSWLLPRRIGDVRARQMLELARVVEGAQAEDWGMIHAAVEPSALDATVEELVAEVASSATVALGLTQWLLHSGRSSSLETQLRDEAFAMELSSRSEDFRIGLKAFAEKQTPEFTGR